MPARDLIREHIVDSIKELGKFTWINEISRKSNLCSATVSKYVDILEKEGIIKTKQLGNSKMVIYRGDKE